MKEEHISTWKDLYDCFEEIDKTYGKLKSNPNPIYYRGQTDSNWPLRTTLERVSYENWSLCGYATLAWFCHHQIVSHTNNNFDLPKNRTDFNNVLSSKMDSILAKPISIHVPFYEYWCYLRHHGFPSPLLDWSASPWVATFFALSEKTSAESAAVFVYVEHLGNGKTHYGNAPEITVLGSYVETHSRHFIQQSNYTIATKKNRDKSDIEIVSYDSFGDNMRQDLLIKIIIPMGLRLEILKRLNQYNINHYSLFKTEDSLMKYLGMTEIELAGLG